MKIRRRLFLNLSSLDFIRVDYDKHATSMIDPEDNFLQVETLKEGLERSLAVLQKYPMGDDPMVIDRDNGYEATHGYMTILSYHDHKGQAISREQYERLEKQGTDRSGLPYYIFNAVTFEGLSLIGG